QARLAANPADDAFFQAMLGDVRAPCGSPARAVTQARCDVDPGLARRVRSKAAALGVSAAALCHLAWALVLARLESRDDVVFGTVLSGRLDGAASAIGLHLNTLPLRIRLRAQGVRDAVRETHRLLAELLRRQHARPLPVFSALFNYRHSAAETRSGPAAGIERLGFDERTHYPLALSVDDFGEAFALSAQAAAPLDPQQVCGLMHAALDEVVAGLERSPENPLAISGHGSEAPRRARATQKRR